jgi:hypothetical protein
MAAHRHWAVLVTARSGSGNGVGLAEVQMRASPGGANISTGGVASGDSSFGHVAANAFDGSTATIWHNASTGGARVRLAYDFGAPVSVAEVMLSNPGAATAYPGATFGPAVCWVQWSDDGVAWTYAYGSATDVSALPNGGVQVITGISDDPLLIRATGAFWRLPTSLPPRPSGARVSLPFWRYDSADSGTLRIAGTVAIDGTPIEPVARRVRLFHQLSGRLVREVWSDPVTGAFAFEGLRHDEYLVLTDDLSKLYDPVARDRRVPVA